MKRLKQYLVSTRKLRLINNLLTLITVGLGLYIVIAPFLPQAEWLISKNTPLKSWLDNSADVKLAENKTPDDKNRLFIEKLGIDEVIQEGNSDLLRNGILRRQNSSTPDVGSNTVIIGHRFAYGAPGGGIFYHLDKISVGDQLVLHWQGIRYDYVVDRVFVVHPNQVEIEAPTEQSILTLYTCTPLWSAKDRLIVQAKLQGTGQ